MHLALKFLLVSKIMNVLIATSGRSQLLGRTLQSLSQCLRADSFRGVIVVENGLAACSEEVCRADYSGMNVEYYWSPIRGKNAALNFVLEQLPNDRLVLFSDDDILFCPKYLLAYEHAAFRKSHGYFFGGPFGVEYEEKPQDWLLSFLPLSARGWRPGNPLFDPLKTWFIGFNWAAFVRDIKSVGMLNCGIGPGSKSNSTGDEVAIQKLFYRQGLRSSIVPDAMVWHHVPACRCTPQWALERAYRDGIARGEFVLKQRGARLIVGHVSHGLHLVRGKKLLNSAFDPSSPVDFTKAFRKNKALGYFSVFNSSKAG
jgi:hypothetical protein